MGISEKSFTGCDWIILMMMVTGVGLNCSRDQEAEEGYEEVIRIFPECL